MNAHHLSKWLLAMLVPCSGAELVGCATSRPAAPTLHVEAGYCDPPGMRPNGLMAAPLLKSGLLLTSEASARYPRRVLLVANACGVLAQLPALTRLEQTAGQRSSPEATLALLVQRQQVLTQVQLTANAVTSIAAELDCEGQRAHQVAGYLSAQARQRTQRFTVLSIGAGALTGAGTALFGSNEAQIGFGVGGGVVTAGLALLSLTPHPTVLFPHPRNLLADIWLQSAHSTTYPPAVWYLLNDPAFSNSGASSVAHNTRRRWETYGQLMDQNSAAGRRQQALLFGAGGAYGADELQLRANLLNELQAAVRLINQDLGGLLQAIAAAEQK